MANKRIINIFFEGLKIYALNIHKFLLYMAFPVLGQLLGLFLIFGTTYWFTMNYQDLLIKYPALKDMSTMLLCTILLIVPGLLLYMKAFWDFLVSYVALNSMTKGYLNTSKVYDFKAHNQIAYNKTFSFIALWFLFGLFILISIIPVFWILGLIFFIYFILIFQVFTFEEEISPIGCFKKSFEIIKCNFAKTAILAIILLIFTFNLLPSGLSVIFDYLNLTNFLSKAFESWAYTLPLEPLEGFGITPSVIGKTLVGEMILFITIGFTLPLRSICWTLWYKNFSEVPLTAKKVRKTVKKTTTSKNKVKKLPENFKIEKRGIDPEIIRRARLEDDEY